MSTKPANGQTWTLADFGIRAQLAEVRRELAFRKLIYPRMIARGTKSREDAEKQIAAMEAVAETLFNLCKREEEFRQPKLL